MNPTIRQRLAEVTAQALEKLAFIFAFPVETIPAADDQNLETVRVDFSGPFSGSMELSWPESALSELAVNMLGVEDDSQVSAEQGRDALKEFGNVVCGNLLPMLAGDAEEFCLSPPYLVSSGTADCDESAAVGYLKLENGSCRVRMRVVNMPTDCRSRVGSADGHASG